MAGAARGTAAMMMAGLVMAGGRGSRMSASGGPAEKLLIERAGRPAVLSVVDALRGSGVVSSVHAATSPHAPAAAEALRRAGVGIVPTAGAGYSADLAEAVSALARAGLSGPAVVVPGDAPLLTAAALRSMASMYGPAVAAAAAAPRPPPAPVWACFVAPRGRPPPAREGPQAWATPEGDAAYTGVSIVDLRGAAEAARSGARCGEVRIPLDNPAAAAGYNVASDIGRLGGLRPGA